MRGVVLMSIAVVAATGTALLIPTLAARLSFRIHENAFIDSQVKYQVLFLPVALSVALCAYAVSPDGVNQLLQLGQLDASAKGVWWLGVGEGESWASVGAGVSVFATAATFFFVRATLNRASTGFVWTGTGWVCLIAAANALSEELIFRLGIVAPAIAVLLPEDIYLLSAALFGLAHLRGMPSGVVGVAMAGLLGWFLAKSVVETHGLGWAWFVHFLQDVVIFFGLASMAARSSNLLHDSPSRIWIERQSMKKICIVGASGKLGRYMVQHALKRGYEVVGVCRERSVGKLDKLKGRITVIPGATNDREVIKKAVAGCDGVLTVLVPWGVHQYSSGTAQAVLDHARPGARLIFSCGWHITRDGQDVYSWTFKALVKIFGWIARLIRVGEVDDQVEACRRVFASDTRWTVVRGSSLEEGESQGLPVWSRHVGDPILESDITRRVDFALFMVAALENDGLIHEAPAIVGCQAPSALAATRTQS